MLDNWKESPRQTKPRLNKRGLAKAGLFCHNEQEKQAEGFSFFCKGSVKNIYSIIARKPVDKLAPFWYNKREERGNVMKLEQLENMLTATDLVAKYFSTDGVTPVKTGKRGRPVVRTVADAAGDYLSPLPQGLLEELGEDPSLTAGLLDVLALHRRELTGKEKRYVLSSRDASVMKLLDEEPSQEDYFVRFTVERKEKETLGEAFLRRYNSIVKFAQEEANNIERPLYIIVCRYAVERGLRNEKEACEEGAPLSGIGLMSKNIVSIILTDNAQKEYKGQVSVVATLLPEVNQAEVKELQEVLA
jgi:hypothetical protein